MKHTKRQPQKVNITAELVAHRGGVTRGEETLFRCLEHDDHVPSASWHESKGVYFCHSCRAAGGAPKLAGLLAAAPTSPRNTGNGGSR